MWTIIIGAIVSLLVFFFEQWWKAHHPTRPTQAAKDAFMELVARKRHFWMGPNRQVYAAKLFDKFVANYDAKPPAVTDSECSPERAKAFAERYAKDLTLEPSEI